MSKELSAKCKKCRRAGEKLFLKGERCNTQKCAVLKRNYAPGVHGPRIGKFARLTGYGTQLKEKQKAKRIYQILEKQFYNYFKQAIAQEGETGNFLYQMLENRLDNVVYRLGFAGSRAKARQMITHRFFTVNGKILNIPSHQVNINDIIAFNPTKKDTTVCKETTEALKKQKDWPDWLFFDVSKMEGKVVGNPQLAKDQKIDMKLIVEFYSR